MCLCRFEIPSILPNGYDTPRIRLNVCYLKNQLKLRLKLLQQYLISHPILELGIRIQQELTRRLLSYVRTYKALMEERLMNVIFNWDLEFQIELRIAKINNLLPEIKPEIVIEPRVDCSGHLLNCLTCKRRIESIEENNSYDGFIRCLT